MKDVGRANFHFKVRVYPHHVLRENKQATGAGADRVSEGMRLAFGKAVGTAARVASNQRIFTVFSTPTYLEKVKEALRNGAHKLPSPSHLKVSTIKVSGRIIAAKFSEEKVVAPPVVAAEEPKEVEAATKGADDHKGGKGARGGKEPVKGAEDKKGAAPVAKGAEDKKGAEHAKGGKGKK
jgi:large subunit ribosomal protein L10e